MIKKRILLPAAAGALALTIGLAGIWFNQRLPTLAESPAWTPKPN